MQEIDPRREMQGYQAPSPFVRFLSFLMVLAGGVILLAVVIGVYQHFHTIEAYSWWVVEAVVVAGVLVALCGAGYWLSLRIRHAEADLEAKKQAEARAQAWHDAELEKQRTQLHADERGNYPVYLPKASPPVPPLVFPAGNQAFLMREGRRAVKEVIADQQRLLLGWGQRGAASSHLCAL